VKGFAPYPAGEFGEEGHRTIFFLGLGVADLRVHVKGRDFVHCRYLLRTCANALDLRIRNVLPRVVDHGSEGAIIAQVLLSKKPKKNDLLGLLSPFYAVPLTCLHS